MRKPLLTLLTCITFTAYCSPSPESIVSDFGAIVQQSKDKVFASVVYIKCVRDSYAYGKKVSEQVSGSGVLISATGEILTNWHVIDKAKEVRCLLFDGRHFTGKVIGRDKDIDLALVKLDRPDESINLPFAELGDSATLTEGDFVMAMGAPFGLTRSVSIGIISCKNRFLNGISQYSLWLQTDASINPGNSGGPLVNTDGKVVGINTLGIPAAGNMGFAVPSATIRQILPRLKTKGNIEWSWTGIEVQAINDFNRNMFFPGKNGVIVGGTEQNSPARGAGIQARDRLLEVNGEKMNGFTEEDLPEIRRKLALLPIGKPAVFLILRDGQTRTVDITPRQKGAVEGDVLDTPRWDMTLKEINQFNSPALYFHKKQGVFIYALKRPGNAVNARLQNRDIILRINESAVNTIQDAKTIYKDSLANIKANPRIKMTIMRNGSLRQIILDMSKDYDRD